MGCNCEESAKPSVLLVIKGLDCLFTAHEKIKGVQTSDLFNGGGLLSVTQVRTM